MIAPATTPEAKQALAAWLANQLGTTADNLLGDTPCKLIGVLRSDGALMGAVMFSHYRPPHIEVACAGVPGWVTRADLRAVFSYPFLRLGCWTVLGMVGRYNAKARDFNKRLGFRELCVVPGPSKASDMVLHSMTRPECRWLAQGD